MERWEKIRRIFLIKCLILIGWTPIKTLILDRRFESVKVLVPHCKRIQPTTPDICLKEKNKMIPAFPLFPWLLTSTPKSANLSKLLPRCQQGSSIGPTLLRLYSFGFDSQWWRNVDLHSKMVAGEIVKIYIYAKTQSYDSGKKRQ